MPRPTAHFWTHLLLVGGLFSLASPTYAQSSPARDLLRLVPHEEIGVCVLVPNLRENIQRLQSSAWLERLEAEPFAQGLLRNNPHWARIEAELNKHLQIKWSELRDEILGDAVVLAYRPRPPGEGEREQGLFLLHARSAERLARLVERINDGQKKSGELTELLAISHRGKQYFRRVEKTKTHFYYLEGSLLAFSGTEVWIQRVIERAQQSSSSAFVEQFERSEADKAIASLWLNPGFIANEIKQKAVGPAESLFAKSLASVWPALDGIFVSAHLGEQIEVRLSLQARVNDIPAEASKLFAQPSKPSDLWRQFPSDSVVAVAGRVDLPSLAAAAESLLPAGARDGLMEAWKQGLKAATGLHFNKEVLPNVGPDWGFAIWPALADDWPHFVAAFAVRPGANALPVDKSLVKALHLLASFAVFDFNLKHGGTLRLESAVQDNVQIHYLDDPTLFPKGVRPSLALKHGYVVLASSPDAVARFGKELLPELPGNETPLVRISLSGIAKLLDHRREQVVSHVAERNGISKEQARDWLSQLRTVLDFFEQFQLIQRTDPGQAIWILRLQPKHFAGK